MDVQQGIPAEKMFPLFSHGEGGGGPLQPQCQELTQEKKLQNAACKMPGEKNQKKVVQKVEAESSRPSTAAKKSGKKFKKVKFTMPCDTETKQDVSVPHYWGGGHYPKEGVSHIVWPQPDPASHAAAGHLPAPHVPHFAPGMGTTMVTPGGAIPNPRGAIPLPGVPVERGTPECVLFTPAGEGDPPTLENGEKPRALDLFSGTGSVARRLKDLGYEVTTLDIDPRANALITTDVMHWEFTKYPRKHFQLIAASVPCNEYSIAKTVGQRDLQGADRVVRKVLEIIKYFEPEQWWIENPRTGMLKDRPFMKDLPFVDVDYCQYSAWGYRKPTRIWGSKDIVERGGKICSLPTCPNAEKSSDGHWRHKRLLGGNSNQT